MLFSTALEGQHLQRGFPVGGKIDKLNSSLGSTVISIVQASVSPELLLGEKLRCACMFFTCRVSMSLHNWESSTYKAGANNSTLYCVMSISIFIPILCLCILHGASDRIWVNLHQIPTYESCSHAVLWFPFCKIMMPEFILLIAAWDFLMESSAGALFCYILIYNMFYFNSK